MDAQAIAPPGTHPAWASNALQWWNKVSGDPLMGASPAPAWFQGIVYVEVTLQMLYFFFAIRW